MPKSLDSLDPAVLQTAREAAQFQPAAATPQYRLVYLTVPGCSNNHDYLNLKRSDALPNVQVLYANIWHPGKHFVEKGETAPGQPLPAPDFVTQQKWLEGRQLAIYNVSKAVLLAPDGQVMRIFPSTQARDFVDTVRALTGNVSSRAHGVGRL